MPFETLLLLDRMREQIEAEARIAFPRECCGLVVGECEGTRAAATALYPTRNVAADIDRFEVDPAEHIRLLRELRGTGRTIIGCYHSHPGGEAVVSAQDQAGAADKGFIWVIAALNEDRHALSAFVTSEKGFLSLRICISD